MWTDKQNEGKLPPKPESLKAYMNQVSNKHPWVGNILANDKIVSPHFLQKAILLLDLFTLMGWLDKCRPLAVDKTFDQVPEHDFFTDKPQRPESPSKNMVEILDNKMKDHILTKISFFLQCNPWDCLSQLNEFFKDREFNQFLLDLVQLYIKIVSYQAKWMIMTIIFFGILSQKVFLGPEEADTRLSRFLAKEILRLVASPIGNVEKETYCKEVLTIYFSAISNKDWLKGSFGDSNFIDEAFFQVNPFYYDDSELNSELFEAHRWAMIPLIKMMADWFSPGTWHLTPEYDSIIKLFFFSIIIEDFSKVPFIDNLLQAFLLYEIDRYQRLIEEETPMADIEFRYRTILELLLVRLNRSSLTQALFERIEESGFLVYYTSLEYSAKLQGLYLDLINVFNRLVSNKLKLEGVKTKDLDGFLVCHGVVDFVMQVFKATFKRKNMLFSTSAGFFRLASLFDRNEVIAATVLPSY